MESKICGVLVVIAIVVALIYLINSCFGGSSSSEGYLTISPNATAISNDQIYSPEYIQTNQEIAGSKTFSDFVDAIKSGARNAITDQDVKDEHDERIDKVIQKGNEVANILKKSANNNILTREEMKQAALAYHAGEDSSIAVFQRANTPGSMILSNERVPVLDTPKGKRNPFIEGRGAGRHNMVATHSIYKVPYYDMDPFDVIGTNFNSSKVFMKASDAKIPTDITSSNDRMKKVSENLYKVNGNRLSFRNSDGSTSDYTLGGNSQSETTYVLNPYTTEVIDAGRSKI